MRISSFISFATFIIGFISINPLCSQTFVSSEIGASLHNLKVKEYSGNIIHAYEGLSNNYDLDFGVAIKHYLSPIWFISLNTSLYVKTHTYTIHTSGINPRIDFTYRIFRNDLKSGVEIIKNLEGGIGFSRMMIYNQKVSSVINESQAYSGTIFCPMIFIKYNWSNLSTSLNFYKSVNNNLRDFDMLSVNFGYHWKVFNPAKGKSKVDCPSF